MALRGGATALVRLPGAPLRLPSLAIHLDRERARGADAGSAAPPRPVWDRDLEGEPGLAEALAAAAGVDADDVVGHDLVLADTQPAARGRADGTWVAAPRLDNLGCSHAGLLALLAATAGDRTQVLVANDHEEVGSGSMAGARGSFLEDVVRRLASATDAGDPAGGAPRDRPLGPRVGGHGARRAPDPSPTGTSRRTAASSAAARC